MSVMCHGWLLSLLTWKITLNILGQRKWFDLNQQPNIKSNQKSVSKFKVFITLTFFSSWHPFMLYCLFMFTISACILKTATVVLRDKYLKSFEKDPNKKFHKNGKSPKEGRGIMGKNWVFPLFVTFFYSDHSISQYI